MHRIFENTIMDRSRVDKAFIYNLSLSDLHESISHPDISLIKSKDPRITEEVIEILQVDSYDEYDVDKMIANALFLSELAFNETAVGYEEIIDEDDVLLEVPIIQTGDLFVVIDHCKQITPLMITAIKAYKMIPVFITKAPDAVNHVVEDGIVRKFGVVEDLVTESDITIGELRIIEANHPDLSHPSNVILYTQ